MVIKVVYAIVVGFVLDFVLRGVLPKGLRGGYTGHADEVDCHEEHNDAEGNEKPIWQAALRHTLEIFVFIFAFSLVFGMIVEGVGEDVFAEMLGGMGFFQPVVAALVGLIPNCAASVLLTQLYVEGALRFSSLVAGLCTGAGVGLRQPLVEAEPLHHRPDMGRRCLCGRGDAGGRGGVCLIRKDILNFGTVGCLRVFCCPIFLFSLSRWTLKCVILGENDAHRRDNHAI